MTVRSSHWKNNTDLRRMAHEVALHTPAPNQAPVIFFNASTRLSGMSLNAAFNLLTAWSLHLQGVPVVNFICSRGMTQCVLATNRINVLKAPPCAECISQSRSAYHQGDNHWFNYHLDPDLDKALIDLKVDVLSGFTYQGVPLGRLALPSIRWILRRHNLLDDASAQVIFRAYICSAWNIKQQFEQLIDEVRPQSVVVFNGMQYPEATARWVAEKQGLKVFSHEVGMQPYSAFFTSGDATAYPLPIPEEFQLSESQNQTLDAYLSKRFKGNFSMAGVQFWPEMSSLDANFIQFSKNFKQVVPVFTNVIFDTSQPHANVVFSDMFEWLDLVLDIAKAHPETLFVIRAHPDEARSGKASEESVADWADRRHVSALSNVVFISPEKFFSSYEMIQCAKFVMIYNSTIGMEASIMGVPVLSAGKARFTQLDTVFFPKTQAAYLSQAEAFLNADQIEVPKAHRENARRFLYFQLFRSSLPFEEFLEEDQVWRGYVRLRKFGWQALLPANSNTLQTIANGILHHADFLLPES